MQAEVTEVGLTNSYSVSSINYAPPYAFDQGTPIIAGYDDVWSEIIPLPFTFCFFGNTYDKIVIGVNGVITFDTTLASPPGFNFFTASQCDWPFFNLYQIQQVFHIEIQLMEPIMILILSFLVILL